MSQRRIIIGRITKATVMLHVRVDRRTGCWNWVHSARRNGIYGTGSFGGKTDLAHRGVWKLLIGPIPAKMCLCHKCDNGICVNPKHLFIGTCKDNMRDCKEKGRQAHGETRQAHIDRG